MKANTASRTAQYMALFRALENARPRHKRLFSDPFAVHFLDKGLKFASRAAKWPVAAKFISRIIQRRIPGAYGSGLARTRYIDDLLQQTITAGVQQVIILGAGFDTRALRLGFLHNIPVIEIDHPDTARLKLNTLQQLGPLPANTHYLQIDFNTQSLEHLLLANHIDFNRPTTIIWEGVTNYLEAAAIDKTFALLQKFTAGSYIIFTYVDKQVLDDPSSFFGAQKLLNDLNEIEERWTFGFDPARLASYLQTYGCRLLQDAGAAGYREKYVPERKRLNKGYEFYRVAFALREQ